MKPGRGEGSWVEGGRAGRLGRGRGRARRGELRRGCRETQTGDQGLSVISCSKYIEKMDGQTMRCIEELFETFL